MPAKEVLFGVEITPFAARFSNFRKTGDDLNDLQKKETREKSMALVSLVQQNESFVDASLRYVLALRTQQNQLSQDAQAKKWREENSVVNKLPKEYIARLLIIGATITHTEADQIDEENPSDGLRQHLTFLAGIDPFDLFPEEMDNWDVCTEVVVMRVTKLGRVGCTSRPCAGRTGSRGFPS